MRPEILWYQEMSVIHIHVIQFEKSKSHVRMNGGAPINTNPVIVMDRPFDEITELMASLALNF